MLKKEQQITALHRLGKYILSGSAGLKEAVSTASQHNKWFTRGNVEYALKSIAENFLNEKLLRKWLQEYELSDARSPLRIGIVMAGNIPLAGFHDLLCVLITGNIALIRQSSKDKHLLPHLLGKLCEIEPRFSGSVVFAEQLKNFDAVIATGSNNTSRYFEYYFRKYPHIIRRNRTSVAVLTGRETKEELRKLGDDIFLYFGLGCRSVSKLYVPHGFDFMGFFDALQPFQSLMMHSGYKNNYDYSFTLNIMNKTPHYASGFLVLQENPSLASPIATLNFEYYRDRNELAEKLKAVRDGIQCVVANDFNGSVAFGRSQSPQLWDYADGVDTVKFLLSLR